MDQGGPIMNDHDPFHAGNTLAECDDLDAPVRVASPAYLHFADSLDRQLRKLVIRWSHAASPWARGSASDPRQMARSLRPCR
jgi:hypothetical protein